MGKKNLDWNDFQYLVALEEGRTMKRAAELMGTDPTTVSRHVKQISDRLGTMLFSLQHGGDWKITAAGRQITTRARAFQQGIEELDLNNDLAPSTRTVKVTSLDFLLTNYLAPALKSGLECYPNTRIELMAADKRISLAFGEADLALRFGRPTEGQLVAGMIAEIEYSVWRRPGTEGADWVGLQEELDWTPEMKHGFEVFDRAPKVRVPSYAAARVAALELDLPFIVPSAVLDPNDPFVKAEGVPTIRRELWGVIHASRRLDRRLAAVRGWAKEAVQDRI